MTRRASLALRIGRVPVELHWSATLFIAAVLISCMRQLVTAALAVATFFAVMLLHELGHAWLAQRRGATACWITLYPFFGVCRYAGNLEPRDVAAVAWGGVAAQSLVAVPACIYLALAGFPRANALAAVLAIAGIWRAIWIGLNLLPVRSLDGATAWRLLPLAWRERRARPSAPSRARRSSLRIVKPHVLAGLAVVLAAPAAAQPWLPAAADAAHAELTADWGFTGDVTLVDASTQPIATPAPAGFARYSATVDGTSWVAWGVLDDSGVPVVSALSLASDPDAARQTFAAELAGFRAGTVSVPLWNAWLYELATPLSAEIRASLARAVLAIWQAQPTLSPGNLCSMALPLQQLVLDTSVPATRVTELASHALATWDLDQPPFQARMAYCPRVLQTALYNRLGSYFRSVADEDTYVLPVLAQLVNMVTAENRATHPGYDTLLTIVAFHHLDQVQIFKGLQLPGRDPLVVHHFLADWFAAHPGATASNTLIETMQRTIAALPPSSSEAAEESGWVLQGLVAQIAGLQPGYALGAATIVVQEIDGAAVQDVAWFLALPPASRSALVEFIVSAYQPDLPASAQAPAVRFLAWLFAQDAMPADCTAQAHDLLVSVLPTLVARRLAAPLPPAGSYYDGDLTADLQMIVEIARVTGGEAVATPLVDAWNPRFVSALYPPDLPPESDAEYAVRLAHLRDLWQRDGLLILDRETRSMHDLELLRGIERYFDAAPAEVRHAFDAMPWGRTAYEISASDSLVFFQGPNDFSSYGRNYERLMVPSTLRHEVGHLVHHHLPPAFNVAWMRLYESAVNGLEIDDPGDPDDYAMDQYGYASDRGNEDVAEHMRSFFGDHDAFLHKAVSVAQARGRTTLLEKYLLIADYMSRGLFGGTPGRYPRLQAWDELHDWEDGGNVAHMDVLGWMEVRARDAEGRITELRSDEDDYQFTWVDGHPSQVTADPLPVLVVDGFEGGLAAWVSP